MANRIDYLENKMVDLKTCLERVAMWKMTGKEVVFTNGCFDILHKGHVQYLMRSAMEGNRLVIGLNSDASVKRQGKGDNRPINDEQSRAYVLAALSCVDAVVIFDEDTPFNLIKSLQPDVLTKGADYDPEETDTHSKKYMVGSDIVRSRGGRAVAIDFVEGFSTTSTIKKMGGH